jgi:hypothetical protein
MRRSSLGNTVKLDKLVRQLRRDIVASPKKAAALGLMVLVALYFWAPMAWGWIASGVGGATRAAADSDVILDDDPVDPAAQAKKARHVFQWEKVRKLTAADPRMTPALFDSSWNNPFRAVEPKVGAGQGGAGGHPAQPTVPVGTDPAQAGLTLTSVAIGARRRSATISGDSYMEGEIVKVGDKDGETGAAIEFRLVRVGFSEVELARDGQIYKLKLQRSRLAGGDEIIRKN